MAGRAPNGEAVILVVDDDDRCRAAVGAALHEAGFATVEAGSAEEALDVAAGRPLSLAVLDVHLPVSSGYELCRRLLELQPRVPVIFLSGERTESFDRVAGLLVGADDYLVKPFDPDELAARVRAVLRRAEPSVPARAQSLTRRELEVLRLLAGGLDQRQIAAQLVISAKTVGTHIERILGKLGVHSRAQAVALAYRDELLSPVA